MRRASRKRQPQQQIYGLGCRVLEISNVAFRRFFQIFATLGAAIGLVCAHGLKPSASSLTINPKPIAPDPQLAAHVIQSYKSVLTARRKPRRFNAIAPAANLTLLVPRH